MEYRSGNNNVNPRQATPAEQRCLESTLQETLRTEWPAWSNSSRRNPLNLTVRRNDIHQHVENPKKVYAVFAVAQLDIERLRSLHQQGSNSSTVNDLICEGIKQSIIHAIHGSNTIEHAGYRSYELTYSICERIFHDETVEATIDPRDDEFTVGLLDLNQSRRIRDGEDEAETVLRARREVIQHARAMEYMIEAVVLRGEILSEELISQTHTILCHGITNSDGTPSDGYAGQYRTEGVWVEHPSDPKPRAFIHHIAIPSFMVRMCARYKADIEEIERTGSVDPFALAAKYSYIFVNINPFGYGNGRMCRIILNTILLKYAGLCVPIGEDGVQSREGYFDLARGSDINFLTEDYDDFRETGHEGLAGLVVQKAAIDLEKLLTRLSGTL